jgi:hypothetical protein
MKELFVPYEQAFDLRGLGLDEPCIGYYNKYKKLNNYEFWATVDCNINNLKTPLYQQSFKWFREKYGLYPSIISHDTDNHIFTIVGEDLYESDDEQDNFDTHEEAENACLKKLIEIAKKIKK